MTYYIQENKILPAEFSSENMGARREWDIFKMLKEKNC